MNRKELIVKHIPLAKKLAKQFYLQRPYINCCEEDIEGAALIGLCDAASRFDCEKNTQFKTYAFLRIRGSMVDYLRKSTGIQRRHFNRLVLNQYAENDTHAPNFSGEHLSNECLPFTFAKTADELATFAEIPEHSNITVHPQGDYKPELSYASDKTPEEIISIKNSKAYAHALIERLPAREQTIIRKRYFESMTFDEISKELNGLSKSWASRLHNCALEKLRTMIVEDRTQSFAKLAA